MSWTCPIGPDAADRPVALVDPSDPTAVLAALSDLSRDHYGGAALRPVAILTTHKHWDHAAGNVPLREKFGRSLRVYGGEVDAVSGCTHPLRDGDEVRVGSLRVVALSAPGHTAGSTAFLVRGSPSALFGGDVLFCGGCGAPFEGCADDMVSTFAKLWRSCPPETLLFPGHEYTLSILPQYVTGALPGADTPDVYAKLCAAIYRARELRAQAPPCPTAPLALADELSLNEKFAPLRHAAEALVQAWRLHRALEAATAGIEAIQASAEEAAGSRGSSPKVSEGAQAQSDGAADDLGDARPTLSMLCQPCEQEPVADRYGGAGGGGADDGGGGGGGVAAFSWEAARGGSSGPAGLTGLGATAIERGLMLVPRARLRKLASAMRRGEEPRSLMLLLEAVLRSPLEGGILGLADATAAAASDASDASGPTAPHRMEELVNITTRETSAAFELLGCLPGQMRAKTLLRAVSCPHVTSTPLSATEAAALLSVVGVDPRGLISAARFEARLGVLPPPPEPVTPGLCERTCGRCCPMMTARVLRSGAGFRQLAALGKKNKSSKSETAPMIAPV